MDTGGSLRHLQEAVFKVKLKLINSKIYVTWFVRIWLRCKEGKKKAVPVHALKSHGGVHA